MAEPWLNPHATAMAIHAFERGRNVAIYTTLQGMSADDADRLITRFGDRVSAETPWVIHLPDSDGNMTGVAAIDRLSRHPRPLSGIPAGTARRRPGHDDHERRWNRRRTAARTWCRTAWRRLSGSRAPRNLDRAAFTPSALLAHVRHTDAVLCASTPFFDHNTMLPNGDVVLCCMDYGRRHVIGNLLRQSYEEIHAGSAMGAIRVQAMTPAAGDLLCRRCHNAVCLTQSGGTHWRLSGAAMWTEAAPEPGRRRPATRAPAF